MANSVLQEIFCGLIDLLGLAYRPGLELLKACFCLIYRILRIQKITTLGFSLVRRLHYNTGVYVFQFFC